MSAKFTPGKTDDIELLRKVVVWANSQREDYWHAGPSSMPAMTVIGVYLAVEVQLRTTIEEVLDDDFPWSEFTEADQAAVNYVRRAFNLPLLKT